MEEMRSFGYICPACGKAVLHSRSVFALNAAAARMECECGKEALEVQTDGTKFRLWVPCGVCGGQHQAECSADALLQGRGIGLSCPVKQELCCYVGQEQDVRRAMENLALRVEKDKGADGEAFTDSVIMYEVLSELKAQGRNLNQLTTLANMGKITLVYGDRLAESYGQVSEQLRQLLREVT